MIVIGGGGSWLYRLYKSYSELGMKIACIDKVIDSSSTCLNVGCIASKVLLNFSKKYHEATEKFCDIEIMANVKLDLQKIMIKNPNSF